MKLIGLGFIAAGIGIGWMVLMFGWGLVPVSWPWIIGGTFGSLVCAGLGQVFSSMDD